VTREINVNESAANRPNRFLADLTAAMRSTAELARDSSLVQCQAEAKTYVEGLQSRTSDGSDILRKDSDEDVSTIRERSKARVERIRAETEQRISRRRELLEQELQEYNAAVELEIERVQQRVSTFEAEVSKFFETLLQGADPTTFATMASQMPDAPAFTDMDRETLAQELRASRQLAAGPAEASAPAGGPNGHNEELPDYWWMDSPAALAARKQAEEQQ
jgi:hypothetical protein